MVLFEIFAVGAVGFWILLGIVGIIISEMLDNDLSIGASIVAVVTGLVLYVAYGINPITWIASHPAETFLYALGYFAVGAVWSLVKWYFYLMSIRRRISDIRAEHPGWDDRDVKNLLNNSSVGHFPPQVSDNKSRIIGWIALWPASMLWTVINDPVRKICEEIYRRLGGVYQGISNRVFRDI